jgi:hypothetical protein
VTSVPIAETLAAAPARSRRSAALGALGELLLVGGLTPVLYPLSWLLSRAIGLDDAELAVGFTMFYAAYVINDPHFAVTYLLFYRDARARALGGAFAPVQRARYVLAGFVVPLAIGAWAIAGLVTKSPLLLGRLTDLMFFLVGWHYCKQGFGALMVLAGRRGVSFLPRERYVILAHAFTGWIFAWSTPADPGREVEVKGVVYTTIAQPAALSRASQIAFLVTLVALVVVLVQKRRRERRLPLFTPLVAFLCSVWAWTIFSSVDPLVLYVIPALHSVQYLYFVRLLEGNEAREREREPWFERSAKVRLGVLAASALGLGWILFHGAPWALDDTVARHPALLAALGSTPYLAAINAFVNIHHYFMDHVIWRRENPRTRYLMR